MQLRLIGAPAETDRAVRVLRAVLNLRSVSAFYPNRGSTRLGRVYVDAEAPHLIPTQPEHHDRKDRNGHR